MFLTHVPRFIVDPIIRHKTALHDVPLAKYTVRIARTVSDYEAAFRLVHAAYTFLGIERVRRDSMRILPQHMLPDSTVFVVFEGEHIVATMTVIEDSPSGLPLDKQYPAALADLRRHGAKLVEYASLAVVKRCWGSGVTQLLSMAAYNFAYNYLGATHTVVGTHPRAGMFYRAMFDFKHLGQTQRGIHSELVGAPLEGFVQDMVAAQKFVREKFRKTMISGKLPIEHFLGEPPICIEMPPKQLTRDELKRWKLPREVFQALFVAQENRVSALDDATRQRVEKERSRATLNYSAMQREAGWEELLLRKGGKNSSETIH